MVNLSNYSDSDNAHPSWSPDGLNITFASNRSGRYDIFVVNVGGVGLTNLTAGADVPFDASYPVWSPDGTRITFTTMGQIWVMNANGTGAAPVSTTPVPNVFGGAPAWSPDSTQIVFPTMSGNATFALYVATVGSSGAPLKINSGNSHEGGARWAPSSRIVFDNLTDIFSVKGDGTGLLNLTNDSSSNNNGPVPIGTGASIAFTSQRDGHTSIWAVPVAGGTATRITNNTTALSEDSAQSTTSDSSLLAFGRATSTIQLNNSIVTTSQVGVSRLDGSDLHLFNATGGSNAAEPRFSTCQ